MAIYIHCPQCHQQLDTVCDNCTHCGLALPPGVLYALSSALGVLPKPLSSTATGERPAHLLPSSIAARYAAGMSATSPAHHGRLRPWLAAVLSLICGLGQLYNGQRIKGTLLLVCATLAVIVWSTFLGKLLALCLWLYAVSDAYLVARRALPPAIPRPPGQPSAV